MSREAVLILEDNDEKLFNVLLKFKDVIAKKEVYIARNVEQAKAFVLTDPGLLWVFLDEELGPGCGTGTQFLEWLLVSAPMMILHVVATSYSLEACKRWRVMCEAVCIPIQRSWP